MQLGQYLQGSEKAATREDKYMEVALDSVKAGKIWGVWSNQEAAGERRVAYTVPAANWATWDPGETQSREA